MNNELLITDFMPGEEGQAPYFEIKDDLAADWALDKIREARADINRIEMVAKAKIDQIQAAVAAKTKEARATEDYFTGALKEYFKKVPLKGTKTQRKYDLPSGKLIEKDKPWTFNQDKEELLAWAEHTDPEQFVKTTQEARWADIKKAGKITTGIFVEEETGIVLELENAEARETEAGTMIIVDKETGEVLEGIKYINYPVLIYKDTLVAGVQVTEQPAEFKVEV